MRVGDVCRIRVDGKIFIGKIASINRKVTVEWTTHYPRINNHKRSEANFEKHEFITAPENASVRWVIKREVNR